VSAPGSTADERREWAMSVASLAVSFVSVALFGCLTFRGVWPWEAEGAWPWALQLAGGVMGILLVHELGHYIVARRHGIDRSPPYFIPLPFGFGTLGAIIRLRSLPTSRSGLLEMAAAGPLAGFGAAALVMALGLPGTVEKTVEAVKADPALIAAASLGGDPVTGPLSWVLPTIGPGEVPLSILANPLLMDLLGVLINGAVPSRYAELHPLALAGWLGCHLTAMNLLPAGQLDGGHILSALWPKAAARFTRLMIGLLLLGGFLWGGWFIWGLLLARTGAGDSLVVSGEGRVSDRARLLAAACVVALGLCLMPAPIQTEVLRVVSP
jgi:membrane-associated protease RseP (regulator of RpoE activity)